MISDYVLVELPRGVGLDGPYDWFFRGMESVHQADARLTYGSTDFVFTALERAVMWNNPGPYQRYRAVMVPAAAPTTVVAYAKVDLPLNDNQHVAEVTLITHPEHRRWGLGSRLLEWVEAIARPAGRTTWTSWFDTRQGLDDEPRVTAPDGGWIPADSPGWRFADHRGWSLQLVERMSVLDLPVDAAWLHDLGVTARNHASGYYLESWVGDVPQRWRPGYANLMAAISTDAPTGGLDIEGEVWDEARIAQRLQESADTGRTQLSTVAIDRASGELAAITIISCLDNQSEFGFQWETIVDQSHRGHRLGLAIKVANLEEYVRRYPHVRRLYTWNAEQNDHMLAINTILGFRAAGGSGNVQKIIPGA